MALGIALFAWLLYLPSLRNTFVWDDVVLIGSPEIQTLDGATVKRIFTTNFWDVSDATSGMYRPLTTLSFYADYQLHGRKPAGFHQTNIILNALASAMVFLVVFEMFSQPLLALIAASWFAAFPAHVESVAWVSGRTDIIATLFSLVSLWFYARWRKKSGPVWAVACLLSFALALLSKEVAVVLPVVIATYELLPRTTSDRKGKAGRWALLLSMCVLLLAYFGIRRLLLGASLGLSRVTHGVVQAAALTFSIIAHYTYKLIYPFRLSPESNFAPPPFFEFAHSGRGCGGRASGCIRYQEETESRVHIWDGGVSGWTCASHPHRAGQPDLGRTPSLLSVVRLCASGCTGRGAFSRAPAQRDDCRILDIITRILCAHGDGNIGLERRRHSIQ